MASSFREILEELAEVELGAFSPMVLIINQLIIANKKLLI